MNTLSKKYDVGYCRPPEHSKWKKGQCGNPGRIRKRPVKSVAAIVDEFFAREVKIVEDGVVLRRSGFEIIYLQLSKNVMAGNTRALRGLTKYSDFAASRDVTGGMIIECVDDEAKPEEGEKNG